MYLKVSVEGLVFGVDRLGLEDIYIYICTSLRRYGTNMLIHECFHLLCIYGYYSIYAHTLLEVHLYIYISGLCVCIVFLHFFPNVLFFSRNGEAYGVCVYSLFSFFPQCTFCFPGMARRTATSSFFCIYILRIYGTFAFMSKP